MLFQVILTTSAGHFEAKRGARGRGSGEPARRRHRSVRVKSGRCLAPIVWQTDYRTEVLNKLAGLDPLQALSADDYLIHRDVTVSSTYCSDSSNMFASSVPR